MARQSPEWFDHMYNNRARVLEAPVFLQRWQRSSAAARMSASGRIDLRYGPGAKETLDVFPGRGSGAPVLVFIHGGYWCRLDKSDHSFIAPAFTRAGACVIVPNYALCPGTPGDEVTLPRIVMQMVAALAWTWRNVAAYGGDPNRICVVVPNYALCPGTPGDEVTLPRIVMQMVAALAWTWRNVAAYGGDPQRICVVGHSAGGHLAAMMLACRWKTYGADLPADLVKSAISISGLHDLEPIRRTPFLQVDLRLTSEQVRKVSPVLLPAPSAGTLHAVVGADESREFLRQNRLIQQAWGKVRVPVCEALPGLNHFSVLEALIEPGHRLHRLARDLLG